MFCLSALGCFALCVLASLLVLFGFLFCFCVDCLFACLSCGVDCLFVVFVLLRVLFVLICR